MGWSTVIWLILLWYVVVQLVALAVLPLTLRVMRVLPDRGYSFAKISGILVVGVVFWLGYSYGLVRNERGGVWLALLGVAAASWLVGWKDVRVWWRTLHRNGRRRALVASEIVFALPFVAWALVRAFDPAAIHTEQPMDLMFMNSIWASPTFPPQDAWLAGYGISYYYLGYWLLTTLARLAGTAPNMAYNIGQAVWYGYLWAGCFAVVMNLLAWRFGSKEEAEQPNRLRVSIPMWSLVGGLLSGVCVAFVGNLQVILEWLYAQGSNIDGLVRWVDVADFPENASQTGQWFISFDGWWWRSSRVIEDLDLLGNHIEVIDEFPMFSYLLGDNHPHLLAMPFVLFVIGLAFNLLLLLTHDGEVPAGELPHTWRNWLPLRGLDIAVYVAALGSLVFLNTWDYPPYWLLLVAVVFVSSRGAWQRAIGVGVALLVGAVLIYLPYFLTAQSQASGIIPNVFNPTQLPQFLLVFGGMLPALVGLVMMGWRLTMPRRQTVVVVGAVVLGVPIGFLALSTLVSSTAWGQGQLARMELPPEAPSYASVIVQRWLAEPWTLLLVGTLLTVASACLVLVLRMPLNVWRESVDLVFVLLLGAIGLALVYAPEFVFLRDHFGSRMNTVFKFYYQGWLLLGLASAYVITVVLRRLPRQFGAVEGLALASLLLIFAAMLFPIAGVYAKTGGFARPANGPTLDATAYAKQNAPDVMAAVEWVQQNTTPDEVVLEGKGDSYSPDHNRISTMTGRATLLGWRGHESQWRGRAFGTMAQGREDVLEIVYRTGSPEEIAAALAEWGIDYVFVGPTEIAQYGIPSFRLDELGAEMDTVFSRGQVRIFRRREGS
jgi:YYY domain-containing protein